MKEPLPSADDVYEYAWYIVGIPIPRRFIRELSLNKRRKLIEWMKSFCGRANDKKVSRIERPRWLPAEYVYGKSNIRVGTIDKAFINNQPVKLKAARVS